ncbi:hypothetical protein [Rhodococcoides fascians]|uniref:hypothetical protein n=1 Tax=Rhodococcoides fascians TaxID=1828 RepID=UPI00050C7D2F|nr:hypothetical protein [Rhodococcus fascians]
MTPVELAAIAARADAATEGPWIAVQRETQYGHVSDVASMKHEPGPGFDFVPIVAQSSAAVDAAFISAARSDIPALLAVLRERDNTIARVRDVADRYASARWRDTPLSSAQQAEGMNIAADAVLAALNPQETP